MSHYQLTDRHLIAVVLHQRRQTFLMETNELTSEAASSVCQGGNEVQTVKEEGLVGLFTTTTALSTSHLWDARNITTFEGC